MKESITHRIDLYISEHVLASHVGDFSWSFWSIFRWWWYL